MSDLWYVGINGQQQGPFGTQQMIEQIRAGTIAQTSYVYGQQLSGWTPISQVQQFAQAYGAQAAAPPPPPMAPAPLAVDKIDFTIGGADMQFVEIVLDPNETVIADAATMFYMDAAIRMEASGTLSAFVNGGTTRQRVAFGPGKAGKIIPIDLRQHGNAIACRKETYLAAAKGITLTPHPSNPVLHKLEGQGLAFLQVAGMGVSRDLAAGEVLRLDQGSLVAVDQRVKVEGQPMVTLTGPGKIWIQSSRH